MCCLWLLYTRLQTSDQVEQRRQDTDSAACSTSFRTATARPSNTHRARKKKCFVSNSGRAGHAVYSFDLPPFPFIFLKDMSASQWAELGWNSILLEARAIRLALEYIISASNMRTQLRGAQICWVSDNQQLILALSSGLSSSIGNKPEIASECSWIYQHLSSLQVEVQWEWLSRDAFAMKLADRLCKVSAGDPVIESIVSAHKHVVLAELAAFGAPLHL